MANNSNDIILKNANGFIAWIFPKLVSDYDVALDATGTPDLALKTIETANKLAIKGGSLKNKGGFLGSPYSAVASYNPSLLPGEVEKLVTLLKNTDRIVQIGTGKGKAMLLTSTKTISPSEYVEKSIDANDALGLSKALKDAVASIVNENKLLRKQVTSLQDQVAIRDRKIAQLNSEVNLKQRTSWT